MLSAEKIDFFFFFFWGGGGWANFDTACCYAMVAILVMATYIWIFFSMKHFTVQIFTKFHGSTLINKNMEVIETFG